MKTAEIERSRPRPRERASLGLMLIAIGVVYGDIGTSPLYVMKSILEGNGGIAAVDREFIIGAYSLIIWTVTLLTTVKYVLIAMKADNNGEGGIFSLYSLVRRYGRFLVIPAMIGGAALLADGILTPAVTVTTAIEGLRSIPAMHRLLGDGQVGVILITLCIIAVLFSAQRAGTSKIGRAFGPVMLLWFAFLGAGGLVHMLEDISVLRALNPLHAVKVLISPNNKAGFMILGSVFLATTGAEALYSDMGHVGKENIYASWPFVKICLLLNYGGQCAWILGSRGDASLAAISDMNPFFLMLPEALRPFAVLMSAAAAIIASQALITGSFTLVSEAINLDLLPHMQISYPAETKGQLYISLVNTMIWIGCSLVVIGFRTSARMEAAYGLAITVTMLMTTVLLVAYLMGRRRKRLLGTLVGLAFGSLETVFFISSLGKFRHGGYVAACMALALFLVMVIWHRATKIEKSQSVTLEMRKYIEKLDALRRDESIPKRTENMVFITNRSNPEYVDRDILYSILDKDPKRAEAYWFLNVSVTDKPDDASYSVETYGTNFVFFVKLSLGFKVDQRINVYLRQIVSDLLQSGEMQPQDRKHSIYGPSQVGNFKFGFIRRIISSDNDCSAMDSFILSAKYAIRSMIGSPIKWYGLETSSLIIESVPMFLPGKRAVSLRREEK